MEKPLEPKTRKPGRLPLLPGPVGDPKVTFRLLDDALMVFIPKAMLLGWKGVRVHLEDTEGVITIAEEGCANGCGVSVPAHVGRSKR